jgi:hypothetical protein
MSYTLRICAVTLLLFVATQSAEAGPMLALSSDAPDLNHLAVGQSFNVQVSLSGLNPGDTLDFLAATVLFEATVLGTPTLAIGPIVPDPTGFAPSALPGLADASYDDLFAASGSPITANGLFYSFGVTVQSAGQGTISFDFVDSSGSDASGAPLPVVNAGGPLTFATATAVPEPSSWLSLGIGLPIASILIRLASQYRRQERHMLRICLTGTLLTVICSGAGYAQADWDGEFTITSQWNLLAMDVPEGSRDEGLAIIQWRLHGRDAQKWRIEVVDAGRGWYTVANAFTGKVLDIRDASKEDRAILIQSERSDVKSQHWRLDKQSDGSYKILSRWSGKAIDIPFGSKEQGTALELGEDNNQGNQRWIFKRCTK